MAANPFDQFDEPNPFDQFDEPVATPQRPEQTATGAFHELRPKATEKSNVQKAYELVTGEGRKEFDIPEFDLPFEFSGRQAKTAFGLMSTFSQERQLNVLKENYPDLKFSEDKFGNVVVDGSAYGGGVGYLNMPGVSSRDLANVGFNVVAFTPAGKAGGAAAGTLARAGRVGGASGLTQAGIDIANQMAGGTPDVSPSNIDVGDVGLAAGGGALFETLGPTFGAVSRKLRSLRGINITDDLRNQVRKAAENAGIDPATVTDDFIRQYVDAAQDAIDPASAAALQQSREFGIPYTKGQATGDIKQLSLEDTLRESTVSPKAAELLRNFSDTQQQRIKEATGSVRGGLAPTGTPIERVNQAAALVREGVQSRAGQLEEAIGQAYEQVGDAYLSGEGVKGMTARLLGLTKSMEWERSPELARASASVVNQLKGMDDAIQAGATIKPAHLNKLESFRRLLNSKAGAAINPTDKRQVLMLKREFDSYLDDAVDNALFSGDESALDALKNARGLRAEYAKKYQRRDIPTKSGRVIKDSAGDIMERLISADPTDTEVANYLFGASKIGARQGSAQLAKRIRDIVGQESDEWQSIRQAAFLKLVEPNAQGNVSGQLFQRRLNEAVSGSGESFMKELFSPQEIGTMKRLATAIKRAQPDIQNPSRTAYKAAGMLRETMGSVMRSLGWVAGGPGMAMATEAGGMLKGLRAANQARKAAAGAVRPFRARLGNVGAAGALEYGAINEGH